ncbi:hypothetical protein EUGRSUZ_H02373 [Eucalyptus grandis]|uniref:Uncharacterized protein n=2 Tax=Eucalyptus grandis TaxID=71139 RepID=A0ACC3JRD5_EUCGR|nr:hypothetical protein EUGRSUZ_H02373 [Eucalyptus grandis]
MLRFDCAFILISLAVFHRQLMAVRRGLIQESSQGLRFTDTSHDLTASMHTAHKKKEDNEGRNIQGCTNLRGNNQHQQRTA